MTKSSMQFSDKIKCECIENAILIDDKPEIAIVDTITGPDE